MNPKLPTPLQNALARQAGGEVHPSPDVLTSFIERMLPGAERDLVTHHLALCADCREVVFLASNAAGDVIEAERKLVAAYHPRPTPDYTNAHPQPAVSAKTPRRRWTPGMSWAVAAVVALLVSGVVLLQRFGSENPAREPVSLAARNSQPSAVAQMDGPIAPSATATLPKTARPATTPAKTDSPKAAGAVVGGVLARKGGEEPSSQPRPAAISANESTQTPDSAEGGPAAAAPLPGTHNSFVESQADTLSQLRQSTDLAKPMVAMRAFTTPHGQWRISADGHLERRVATDDWSRVLANEATTFRVVSVVGSDVWAGGNGGALFRSQDAGQHWSRVTLASGSGAETGTIVAIQFNDPQQGTILTVGGSRWTTSDGGVTWILQ